MNSPRLASILVALCLCATAAYGQSFFANLDGPSESPSNASPGVGFTFVTFDPVTHMLHVQVTFSGLLGMTTASHIHAATAVPFSGTAGVATQTPTFAGFPTGVTSGTYNNFFDLSLLSSWNPAYVSANGGTALSAEAAFIAAINTGRAYLNIHTGSFPSGEIRGFLVPAAVPENGATIGYLAMAAAGLVLIVRRKRTA